MQISRTIDQNILDIQKMPRLLPRMHERVADFLRNKKFLFELTDKFGSPLNFIFPQNMEENIETFQAAYKKHNIRGKIYFSSKPCKSLALYREAASHDIGIDVSSAGSLKAVLQNGWGAERIGATGPKNTEYIDLVLKHNVLINIDNLNELNQLAVRYHDLGLNKKINITIRISDYISSRVQFMGDEDNTFGIASDQADEIFSLLETHKSIFEFQGFSWHTSMASDEQRIAAIENLLTLTFTATKRGLRPSQINIGGGFPIMYADSCQEWGAYVKTIKESVLGLIPPQTWNNTGLGFRMESGVLRGSPTFINHAPVYTKGQELDRWLSWRLPSFGNARLSDVVRDSLLRLCIEPGRGILDQCGVTVGRVSFTKISPKKNRLVGLDMNRSSIHADHFKQLMEPLVIPRGEGVSNDEFEGVFYMGNLCLSYDMLQYNKTYPPYLPQAGDLVAFANTAAYMMDFTESETLMQPVAQKIVVREDNREWSFTKDANDGRPL